MSFSHKAYQFDWVAFEDELAPLLHRCLGNSQVEPLIDFVNKHRGTVSDPHEGELLDDDWQQKLEVGDVQELGDYALTRYYDPVKDRGVAESWMELDATLDAESKQALLGEPFGPPARVFDPGKMGSYFQTPDTVRESARIIQRCDAPVLREYIGLLEAAAAVNMGIYVTF